MGEQISKGELTRWGGVRVALMVPALAMVLVLSEQGQAHTLPAEQASAPSAAIHAVPGSDGESVYIAAGRLGQMAVPVYANITVVGPTSHIRSHTMVYDAGSGEYDHTFDGLFSSADTAVEGTISISTTNSSDLGSSSYKRYKVAGTVSEDLPSTDGLANLHVNAGSVHTDTTYVLIMPTNIPPGDPPEGHELIGQAYSIRASGALTESLQSMTLRMYYDPASLGDVDPHTLSLFAWEGQQWLDLGGTLFSDWSYLSQTVQRFTTYALMATPAWKDSFDDVYGLAGWHNVRLAYGGKLELDGGATSGWAASVPITPTGGLATWGQVSYSATITAGTALTVSVLDGHKDEVLLPSVVSGASLEGIDPGAHPSLKLRVALSSDTPGETSSLEGWEVSWLPFEKKVYLPLVVNGGETAETSMMSSMALMEPTIEYSFTVPGNRARGLTWGDGSLWLVDEDDKVYRLSPTGAVQGSFPITTTSYGLSWYKGDLWTGGSGPRGVMEAHRLDATGRVVETISGTWPLDAGMGGIAWAEDYLYAADANFGFVHKFDRSGDHLLSWETLIFGHPKGMVYDGTGLWVADSCEGGFNTLHRYSLMGELLDIIDLDTIGIYCDIARQDKRGLAWDGQYLWYTADDIFTVYKLDIGAPLPPCPEDHVLVVDEQENPAAGAYLYQNGALIGITGDNGCCVPSPLSVGDTLVAYKVWVEQPTVRGAHATLDSDDANWAYRIGTTSMDVSADGSLHPYVVAEMSQPRLVIKNSNPLVLYNLVVSIQWDATLAYTQQISEALRLTSDYLYDVTDGQFAFGNVTIYDSGQHWSDADIQLLARKSVRPYAFVGGVTSADKAWTIRAGRGWDRWADSGSPWNEPDGFRTLGHEFGHYGLFLYDEYFAYKFDQWGNLIGEEISHCTGPENRHAGTAATNASIMDWQYTSSELALRGMPGLWTEDWCTHTVQWQLNGESDWETVRRAYADPTGLARWTFVTPGDRGMIVAGPDAFPDQALPFPAVSISNTGVNAPSRHLTVLGSGGARYAGALVALDHAGIVIDQGFTDQAGEITILGADEGDTVRAMSLDGALSGGVVVTQSTSYVLQLSLGDGVLDAAAADSVNPYVSLVPSSDGRTLYLSLQGVESGGVLYALVAQPGGALPQSTQLAYSPEAEAYTGAVSFTEVDLGTGGLYVRGLGPQGQQVAVDSDFHLLEVDATQESDLYSADGNVQLYLGEESLTGGTVYAALMPTGAVPQPLPQGYQVVGNAYAIRFSGALAQTNGPGVLRLFYHPDSLATGIDLRMLHIYRWDAGVSVWEIVGGELDEENLSVAVTFERAGIYALMAFEGPVRQTYLPLVARDTTSARNEAVEPLYAWKTSIVQGPIQLPALGIYDRERRKKR